MRFLCEFRHHADVASDEKCDEEEEATKILGGNSKEVESEEGEEGEIIHGFSLSFKKEY